MENKEKLPNVENVNVEEIAVVEEVTEKKKDRFLPISILVAAVLIGGSVVFATLYNKPGASVPAAGTPSVNGGTAQAAPSAAALAALALGPQDVVLGNASASVTVIEYGDYQCPYCTMFFTDLQPLIIQKYVDTGKVKFVFRDFPFLDRFAGLPAGANESHTAGAAAECAKDQGKFWLYHDALYSAKVADEARGGSENDGLFNRTLFLKIANQLSMDATAFASCIDSGKYTATVNADYTAAVTAGVNSTPMTFVNNKEVVDTQGRSVGADGNTIFAAIDSALSGN